MIKNLEFLQLLVRVMMHKVCSTKLTICMRQISIRSVGIGWTMINLPAFVLF
jgi:hypothetical protein